MPPGIPAPPTPPTGVILAAGAVCLLLGAVLNVWGRKAGRPLLVLAAGAAAAASAWVYIEHFPIKNVWVVGASLALVGALFALILGRLLWAAALGAVLGIVALGLVAHFTAGAIENKPTWTEAEIETFGAWCGAGADYLIAWLKALWRHTPTTVLLAAAAPFVVCIAVEIVLARTVLILATSVLGAVGVVAGAGLLVLACRADWARPWVDRIYIPALVAALLAVFGAIYQARTAVRERPKKEEAEKDKAGRDETEAA